MDTLQGVLFIFIQKLDDQCMLRVLRGLINSDSKSAPKKIVEPTRETVINYYEVI